MNLHKNVRPKTKELRRSVVKEVQIKINQFLNLDLSSRSSRFPRHKTSKTIVSHPRRVLMPMPLNQQQTNKTISMQPPMIPLNLLSKTNPTIPHLPLILPLLLKTPTIHRHLLKTIPIPMKHQTPLILSRLIKTTPKLISMLLLPIIPPMM